jgi:hypothetical protein
VAAALEFAQQLLGNVFFMLVVVAVRHTLAEQPTTFMDEVWPVVVMVRLGTRYT